MIAGLLAALALAAAPAPAPAKPAPAAPPLRLLIVTLDTLRADRLGAYGYPRGTSPALDGLAGRSTLFADVTCSMPTTLPSHFTIFTGLTPGQHGVSSNGVEAVREVVSIFDLAAARGVPTAGIVAAAPLSPRFLKPLGLDAVYFGERSGRLELPAWRITDRALSWFDHHGFVAGRPEPSSGGFALWLHYFDPHEPYEPNREIAGAFTDGGDSPLGLVASIDFLGRLNEPGVAAQLLPTDRKRVSDLYDGEVATLDRSLGVLFHGLEVRGLLDDTLVVVVGDHGQALGEQQFWGHGEHLLQPIVQVPMLIKLPGQRLGRLVEAPVETLDLMPTLTEALALKTPEGLLGRSLMPAIRGEPYAGTPLRLIERRTYEDKSRRGLTLLAADWKLTFFRDGGVDTFHLGRRGGEGGLDGRNYYDDDSQGERRVLRQVMAERKLVEAPELAIADEVKAMLRSLGYLN